MPDNHRADRVILVSMMKSGTHLVTQLMTALGYRLYGHVRVTPENKPALDRDTRWRLASMVYDDQRIAALKSQGESEFNDATTRAWEALGWTWQHRFGMPLKSWYSSELINTELVREAHQRTEGSSFMETPPGICWVLHEFDIRKIDGAFLREWTETGNPRVIFNYRDPRDAILSMVNFLCGRTKEGLSAFNNLRAFSNILLAKPSLEERLTYALSDNSFPCQADDFSRMAWLLHHPNVCKISFEELVGPRGGGSAEAQIHATAKLMSFLNDTSHSPEDVVASLFNRDSFSFFRGQAGAWREAFTAEHIQIAEARFSEVLPHYGYTWQ